VEHRWLPAVNAAAAEQGWGEWAFIEVANDIRSIKNQWAEQVSALLAVGRPATIAN
jgi:hypothetical protein